MRIITLEDHYSTALNDEHHPKNAAITIFLEERSRHLGYDIEVELNDIGERRVAAMDAAGIDFQVLSLTMPGCQAFGPDEAEKAIRVAEDSNDKLFDAVKRHPARFAGFAALPTADPQAAVGELERAVTRLGFKGALINGHTKGSFLDERRYWPIFERAQALNVPIYLHPSFPHPAAMQSYFRGYEDLSMPVWGFNVDTSIHFLRILFAGVFDEFPGLKIILGHLGEGLPFGMHRLNDHSVYYARRRGLKRTPADYLRENLIVTTSGNFSVPSLLCTISMLGIDNILFSVDWPYETLATGVKFLEDLPISPNDKEKIAHLNAERLLRVPAQNSKTR